MIFMVVGVTWLVVALALGVVLGRVFRAGAAHDRTEPLGWSDGPLYVEDILRAADTSPAR